MSLRGELIPAGTGYAVVRADWDFETKSAAGYEYDESAAQYRPVSPSPPHGLSFVGAHAYADHPSADVISLTYDLKEGLGPRLWTPLFSPPSDLVAFLVNGGEIEAHNAAFEWVMYKYILVKKYGFPPIQQRQLFCSMAKARIYGLPGSLDNGVKALNLPIEKDPKGANLIRQLTVPRKPTKDDPAVWATPEMYPEKFVEFYRYNVQDIVAESALSACVPELSEFEREVWLVDQAINDRGMAVDVEGVTACCRLLDELDIAYTQEIQQLTSGAVSAPSNHQELRAWLAVKGVRMPDMQKETVSEYLKFTTDPDCKRALQIRQETGLASVKKLRSIFHRMRDGRIYGLYEYAAAERTGRFAGRGPQPQNLFKGGPKAVQCNSCGQRRSASIVWCPWCESESATDIEWGPDCVDSALAVICGGGLREVKTVWDDPLLTIAGCLRGSFVAGPGMELMGSDYSAIEAVVAAMIANEQWRIEVFRTHGMIYEMSASKLTGVPFQAFLDHKEQTGQHHPHRQKLGKVSELASAYAGWINAWIQFGADEFLTDDEIKANILQWRKESPNIVEMWGGQWRKHPDKWDWTEELYGLEGCAVAAVLNPGTQWSHNGIAYCVIADVLHCRLPSGRDLHYHQPRLERTMAPHRHEQWQITFMGYNSDAEKGPVGWARMHTYGGKLFENVVQAIARDILAYAMVELEKAGYRIVLHVHDEIIVEVPIGTSDLEAYEALMSAMPWWAKDWPIFAKGGWVGFRFRKD